LVVEGKRETEAEENREDFSRVERSYGSFYRSFNLPDAATNAKKIKAHSHNGVLEITVPISETAQQKKIEIKVD
jgi:HSP20 family protein